MAERRQFRAIPIVPLNALGDHGTDHFRVLTDGPDLIDHEALDVAARVRSLRTGAGMVTRLRRLFLRPSSLVMECSMEITPGVISPTPTPDP